MEPVLNQLIRSRPLHSDDPAGDHDVDLAAVLHHRLSAWLHDSDVTPADPAPRVDASERLAVLEPNLAPSDDHDLLPQALQAVDALIRQRVDNLTERSPSARPGWLPPEPTRPDNTDGQDAVAVLAASRDRTGAHLTDLTPLGQHQPLDDVQRRQRNLDGPAHHQTTDQSDRSEHDRSIR